MSSLLRPHPPVGVIGRAERRKANSTAINPDYTRMRTTAELLVSRKLKCYQWAIVAQFENVTRHGYG